LIGKGTLWWFRRKAEPLIEQDWNDLTQAVSRELGLRREVRLLRSVATSVAITTGIRNPQVLLPACSEKWDPERRRVVLLHELTHIRRRDNPIEVLSQIASILYWFNPFVWLAIRQLKRERERACDDAVLESGTKPSTYAYHLMEVAKDMSTKTTPIWRAATVSQASSLKDRLLCILNPGLRRSTGERMEAAWVTVFIVALVIPLAGFQPWAGEEPRSESLQRVNSWAQGMEGEPQAKDPSSLGPLLAALADEDPAAHSQASQTLRGMKSEEVVSALLDTLRDADAEVRRQAAIALEHLRAARAVPALIEVLRDSDAGVRKHAAIALEHMPTPKAVPVLIKALGDQGAGVRHSAVVALEHIRSRESVPALIEALSDPDPEVRRATAYALEKIGDRRALEALTRTMSTDTDSRVRQAAAHALGRIK
jgi:hypothetical protein